MPREATHRCGGSLRLRVESRSGSVAAARPLGAGGGEGLEMEGSGQVDQRTVGHGWLLSVLARQGAGTLARESAGTLARQGAGTPGMTPGSWPAAGGPKVVKSGDPASPADMTESWLLVWWISPRSHCKKFFSAIPDP